MPEERFKYLKGPGIVDVDKLRADGLYPSEERLAQGPAAVFECAEEIPCNPCETACAKGCIRIGADITSMPRLDERCNGCGVCLPRCPGLCVFILDGSFSESEGTVTMPYELLPLPQEGAVVKALDRAGEHICDATVVSVKTMGKGELCHSLSVAVPRAFIHEVRHVALQ